MSRQGRTEDKISKWNKRLLRLAAAALVVMLLGRIFQPAGESLSIAQDGDVPSETGLKIYGEESVAAAEETEAVPLSGHGTWESMEAYYRDTYEDGDCRAFYADLTHDGQDDLIVLETQGNASDYTLEVSVTVLTRALSGEVYTLYERQLDQSHAGWGWLYLYEENGKDYLVEYDPVLYEGASRYVFSVFYLSAEGERVRLAGDTLEFEWDGELGKGLEDQVRAFNQRAFAYMEQSRVIAAIGEEYISGFENCELGQ